MARPTHTGQWQRCVQEVNDKGQDGYAICTAQLGPSIESREEGLRHRAMAALDDNDGTRGDIAPDVHYPAELPSSQVPGSLKPSILEQKDGKVQEMSSRCAMCGADAKYGGAKCCECAESAPTAPGAKTQAQKVTLDISSGTTTPDPDSNPQDAGEVTRPTTIKKKAKALDDGFDAQLDELADDYAMAWPSAQAQGSHLAPTPPVHAPIAHKPKLPTPPGLRPIAPALKPPTVHKSTPPSAPKAPAPAGVASPTAGGGVKPLGKVGVGMGGPGSGPQGGKKEKEKRTSPFTFPKTKRNDEDKQDHDQFFFSGKTGV